MITMGEFMQTFNYRITEGCQYGWACYGPNAYSLSTWNGEHSDGGWSGNIVFDTVNQIVYEVEVCDYTNERAYRITNPLYKKAYEAEAKDRGESINEAWDCVRFVDLESPDDWLEKAQAIVEGVDYDTRVSVPVDLDDKELFELMKQDHKNDVTLNDYVQRILHSYIIEYEVNTRRSV